MRSLLRPLLSLLALIAAAPANAIIGGEPDGYAHPYVGALDVRPTGRRIPCTGTLISPTVYVTAGHCANFFLSQGIHTASVTFEPVFKDSAVFYTGTVHLHPMFRQGQFANRRDDPHDIGVVVFDSPVLGVVPAELPRAGMLDALNPGGLRSQVFPVIGYGISILTGGPNGGGPPGIDRDSAGTRKIGPWRYLSLTDDWLRFDMQGVRACVGDSGAPVLLGNSSLVIGIGIGGDNVCGTMASDLRLDTPTTRDFLRQFVTLP